ncbi:LOW QUALITY PROTEIN: NACHT, LRR and PYD domains-containing protein 10 [Erethizon dorsatum]
MASALTHNPRKALLWALCDLEESDFRLLKFHLRDVTLAVGQSHLAGELEGLSWVDLASRWILTDGAREAVRVVLDLLKAMNLFELVDQLSHIYLNEHVRCLEERELGVNGSYNQLLLVARSSSGSPSPTYPDLEWELHSVVVEEVFDPEENPPQLTLSGAEGSAGTGKTTLVRKMVLHWAILYPGQFDCGFYVSFREAILLPECNLYQLLFWSCGDNQVPVTEILKQPARPLFILDGFDELQRPFEQLKKWRLNPMENVLQLLIRRSSLPTGSLLISSQPQALWNLESLLCEWCHVHVLGFFKEKRNVFSFYFMGKEEARNDFDFVQRLDVLYKACQIAGICWMVCSCLKGQMEKGQAFSETLSNSTNNFTAYIATILPTDHNGGCFELTWHRVLRGLCCLAAEGIQHQRVLFEEADLRRHNLDGPRLAAFLSSNDYQEGLDIKKFCSFCHTTFQEFFHAMSYLMKDDQSLGEESCREVERLLEVKEQEKNEEMTLSMQFLFDILKKESSLNLGLKVCFKIAPSVMQDLMHFKEQMVYKHNRTWDLEFSLYDTKIKYLAKGA